MTSAEFKPIFEEGVTVAFGMVGPGMQTVNPMYCATDATAQGLASILVDLSPKLVLYPPNGPVFFGLVKFVPWFLFPDGSLANVGLLASYWTHGLSPELSEKMCRRDIQSLMAYTQANQ